MSEILYTVEGAVQSGGGLYITRQADADLFALCRAGTYAHVFAPRQMGKTSLRYRMAEQLITKGITPGQLHRL